MSDNPAQPLALKDRLIQVADEAYVGGYFEGESQRERTVGKSREVVVDVFKRGRNKYLIGSDTAYFLRVSLRCPIDPKIITRYEIDLDRYTTERELISQAMIGGGLVATAQIEKRGASWDPDHVAKQAAAAARELLADINP